MIFPLHFTLGLFTGQRGSKADVAYKNNYSFPKASAIKNIMLPCGPGRKRSKKKENGRQGRNGVKSVDLVMSRPTLSLTPPTLGRGKNRVDAQDAPQSGEPRQKWSSLSKDSHIPWVKTQSQDLGTSKDLSNENISRNHAALEGSIPSVHQAP